MPLLAHRGLNEGELISPFRSVELGYLTPDSTSTICSMADAGILDIGYLLSHGSEVIQVTNLSWCPSTNHFEVGVLRCWNGTPRQPHEQARWTVESVPRVEFRTSTDARMHVRCATCGAPEQVQGNQCRYCGHTALAL